MQWMIDGLYGDLYRSAMHMPRLESSRDEWEIERRMKSPRRKTRRPMGWAALAISLLGFGVALGAISNQPTAIKDAPMQMAAEAAAP